MANKERSFIYSVALYLGLCLYAYYYKKYEMPLLPRLYDDVELRIRASIYPLSFIYNFILALLFYIMLKLIHFVRRFFKQQGINYE